MDNITTPDERGGLWPQDHVSFIVGPAKKGVQAIDVTLEEQPEPESEQDAQQVETKMGSLNLGSSGEGNGATAASGKEKETPVADGGAWDLSSWGV